MSNNNTSTNNKEEIIDKRILLGDLIYDLQYELEIPMKNAVILNERVSYFKGKY